jgi:hypothetical protein
MQIIKGEQSYILDVNENISIPFDNYTKSDYTGYVNLSLMNTPTGVIKRQLLEDFYSAVNESNYSFDSSDFT